jgi:hypothetical protein
MIYFLTILALLTLAHVLQSLCRDDFEVEENEKGN